jgi:FkbM family methyltransferase
MANWLEIKRGDRKAADPDRLPRDDGKAAPVIEIMSFPVGERRVQFSLPSDPEWASKGRSLYYEPEVVNIISRVVRKDDLVIDAGANNGFFTLLMSQLVGRAGLVMAFEPDPNAYKELAFNIEINGFHNVVASDVALWDCDGEKDFWIYPKSGYSSFSKYTGSERRVVQTRKLDGLLTGFKAPRFMKLDCEGAEPWILRGAEDTLRRGVDYVIAELNYEIIDSFGQSRTLLRDYMASLGYHCFLISVKEPDCDDYKIVRLEHGIELTLRSECETRARQVNLLFSRRSDPMATERNGYG